MRRHLRTMPIGTCEMEYSSLHGPNVECQDVAPVIDATGGHPIKTWPAMTTILWGNPRSTTELDFGTPPSSLGVRIRVWIPSTLLYMLVGGPDGRGLSFHRMDEVGQGRWNLTLRLQAGTYQYRYYTDGGVIGRRFVPREPDADLVYFNDGDARFTVSSKAPPPPVHGLEAESNGGTPSLAPRVAERH